MKVIGYILELVYPTKCPFCRKLTGGQEIPVCDSCLKKLPYTGSNCAQQFKYIDKCVAPFYYDGTVREAILRYKFGGVNAYGRAFASFITKVIDENDIFCDIITWVPLSRKRFRKRGYDQARILAEYVAQEKNVRCVKTLNKTKNNPAQSGTGNAAARKANVSGVYKAIAFDEIKDKTVLIIDDVVTTGSTLSECARMLKEAGAEKVYAAAIARHKD